VSDEEVLTPEQLELEALYLGLRTTRGVDEALMFSSRERRMLLREMLRADYVRREGQKVIPTTKGFLVADRMAAILS
jgi:coproporphyrinogen III oxidase-like Fe-S oxidoreductase